MMKNKRVLVYKKGDGEWCINPVYVEGTVSAEDGHTTLIIPKRHIPVRYSKPVGTLSYSVICVISGGTERERDFLVELERKQTFKNLEVVFISSSRGAGGLTPKMMESKFADIYKDGVIELRNNREVELDSVDKVYMITDVDDYEAELRDILMKREAEVAPIWIISNPSFEIWIYYCYRNNPDVDLKGVIEAEPVLRSSLLKTINGKFNKGGGLDPRKAFEHLDDGISNSMAHYRGTNGIPDLLSTQMHLFAQDVLNTLGGEYNKWLTNKRKMREEFKNVKRWKNRS